MDAYSATYYRGTAWNLIFHGNTWTPYVEWYERQTGVNLEDYWGWFQQSWGNKAETYHYYFYADCTTSEIYIGRNGATDYNDDTQMKSYLTGILYLQNSISLLPLDKFV